MAKQKPLIVVLGAHRSGTSFVTQIFSILGFDLGRTLLPPSFDNPKGFWENEKVFRAINQFLKQNDRDWTTVGLESENLSDMSKTVLQEKILAELKDEFRASGSWIVKDPRSVFVTDVWKNVATTVNRDLLFLPIIRNPEAIAHSLVRRNSFDLETAMFIALSYLDQTFKIARELVLPVLCYEHLIHSSGEDIVKELSRLTSPPPIKPNQTAINMIDRLRDPSRSLGFEPETDIGKDYVRQIAGFEAVISSEVLSSLPDYRAELKMSSDRIQPRILAGSLLSDEDQTVQVSKFQLSHLRTENRRLDQKLARANSAFNNLFDRFETVQSSGREAVARLKSIEKLSSDKEAEIERINLKAARLEQDHLALNDNLSDSQTEVLRLNSRIETETRSREALQTDVANLIEQNKTMSSSMLEVEAYLEQLEGSGRNSSTQNLTAIDRLDEISQTLSLMSAKNDELSRENLLLTQEMERLTGRMSELEQNVSMMTSRLAYYDNKPAIALTKRMAFRGFRVIRRLLPLSEDAKIRLSRRFTGLAVFLAGGTDRSAEPRPQLEKPSKPPSHTIVDPADIGFDKQTTPAISIIVPVYNEIDQTLACLKSVSEQSCNVPFEVILADDASPDPDHERLNDVRGLRVFRNPENLGFLENCNQNAAHARGDYIVFLNNDTLVHENWLQALYDTFQNHENVGIAGSKLVSPDGTLQEAGGIIWNDASGWNWGRGQDTQHSKFNFVRDADYVSGASFMITRELWNKMGGFSSELEKAYYEDTYACFQARELGYRVVYQPLSVLTHIEGLTSGTDLGAGQKKYQMINQENFLNRWKDTLKSHGDNGIQPDLAADRHVKGHILYIDAVTPEPDKDSGSVDAMNMMKIMVDQGYRVHFVPGSNFAYWGDATRRLQSLGIECIYHPYYSDLNAFLDERGDSFDYVVLSRVESCENFLNIVRARCKSARLIYNTVDVHHLRLERQAALSGSSADKDAAAIMKRKELSYMKSVDDIVVISEYEKEVLSRDSALANKISVVPLIREEKNPTITLNGRQDIGFIGGFQHPPNVDAVKWIIEDIWPEIHKELPNARLRISGSRMPDSLKALASDSIIMDGYVPDLDKFLGELRLTIAPLRFGAGLKGKVASSLGAGVPCVGTPLAFEGMAADELENIKFEVETAKQFAECCKKLFDEDELWLNSSAAGVEYHNQQYGLKAVASKIKSLLDD